MKNSLKNIWSYIVKFKYIIAILIFGVWIIFLDQTGLVYKNKLKEDIQSLKIKKDKYLEEIEKSETYYEDLLTNPKTKERLAREEYYMSKEDEDVFIIKEEYKE